VDKLITTAREQRLYPEAYARDLWVREQGARLAPGSRVLDAGAGASKYRPFFAHCHYETQDFCKYEGPLVQYTQPVTHVCDITAIPLPDASLDAILCTEVFEHVVDPPAVLREFARLLKPGGRLLLTAPLNSWLHMEPYHFFGGFTHYWYRHWLPVHGFQIESVSPVGGPGRACVAYCQGLYEAWGRAEAGSRGLSRWASRAVRIALRIPFFQLLPRVLPRMDGWLRGDMICLGYMVAAVREPNGTPDGQAARPREAEAFAARR
jgi:SAM-dependent methyltransferase